MHYTITEQLPTPAQYNALRQAVGWGIYDEAVIENALPNTLYCVCTFVNDEIVGMARIIGDGGLVYYIQDVIVLPTYQRNGIGRRMMDKIMAYIEAHAHHNTIIGLMAAVGKEAFYEPYGFIRRPDARRGAGMTRFWE
ncbi:MAG: GNAT family N-acetyltransferase [Anaerolineae bacterium]|nr:GNAT family N-acetyltransferase [Anaerolineae bacterium]